MPLSGWRARSPSSVARFRDPLEPNASWILREQYESCVSGPVLVATGTSRLRRSQGGPYDGTIRL